MCTVVSQFMVSKLILNFFQFVENPYSQNRWLRMAPSRELCSRRTLVRRIQQKLNQVVEIVKTIPGPELLNYSGTGLVWSIWTIFLFLINLKYMHISVH